MLCDYLPWLVPAQPNKQSNILLILLLDQIYKNYAHTCIYLSLIYCFILVYMPHEYLNHVMILCIHKIDNNQRLPNDIIKTEATNDQQKNKCQSIYAEDKTNYCLFIQDSLLSGLSVTETL